MLDANEALYVDEPVTLDTSVPLNVNEPVSMGLCLVLSSGDDLKTKNK